MVEISPRTPSVVYELKHLSLNEACYTTLTQFGKVQSRTAVVHCKYIGH